MNFEKNLVVSDKKQQFQNNINLAGIVFIQLIWNSYLTIDFTETVPYIKYVFDPILGQSFLSKYSNYSNWWKSQCTKNSFPLRNSLVNVTKSAVSCGFGHVYWRIP